MTNRKVGIGTRILNFLIDTLVIFAITYLLYKGYKWYAFQYHKPLIYFGPMFFAVMFVYYTVFEWLTAGTLGKKASLTKVISLNGKKPTFLQVLIRSIVRLTIIDMFFIPFLDKTLHDYLSKTDVVEK